MSTARRTLTPFTAAQQERIDLLAKARGITRRQVERELAMSALDLVLAGSVVTEVTRGPPAFLVRRLRESGVTIILTTHYIEEAEEIADRIGVISNGELLLVEDKQALMHDLGKKQLIVELKEPASSLPQALASYDLSLSEDGGELTYTYDTMSDSTGITALLQAIHNEGLALKDLHITQSSLEDIFVDLVKVDQVLDDEKGKKK